MRSAVTSHLPNPNHYWMLVVTVVWLLSKAAQLHFFYILSSINGNMRSFSVWTSVALKPPSAPRSYGSRFLVCSYDHGSLRLKLVRAFDCLKAGNLSWKTTCAFMAVGLRQMRGTMRFIISKLLLWRWLDGLTIKTHLQICHRHASVSLLKLCLHCRD